MFAINIHTESGVMKLSVVNDELVLTHSVLPIKLEFDINQVYDLLFTNLDPQSQNPSIARRAKQLRQYYPNGVAPGPFI